MNSSDIMPATDLNEEKKGPFSKLASESVLSKLQTFEKTIDESYVFPNFDEDEEPTSLQLRVSWDQVSIEGLLGEGGFSFIFKVQLSPSSTEHYALKCLKAKTIRTEEDLTHNAMDLFTESFLLARLKHQNIIGMHGIVDSNLANSYSRSDGFFVLLDIIDMTLFDVLETWRDKKSKVSRSKPAIVQRIREVISPVVEAMQYIHCRSIILRDLKPENIGFDQNGTVKLFDFGLARHRSLIEEGDIAGSICYMAPETILQEGSFLRSDVFSFAIILWEICTLQIPLVDFSDIHEIRKRVAIGGWRPSTTRIPSKKLRRLIKNCWNRDASERPFFADIEKMLRQACDKEGVVNNDDFSKSDFEMKGMVSCASNGNLLDALLSSRHSLKWSAHF